MREKVECLRELAQRILREGHVDRDVEKQWSDSLATAVLNTFGAAHEGDRPVDLSPRCTCPAGESWSTCPVCGDSQHRVAAASAPPAPTPEVDLADSEAPR